MKAIDLSQKSYPVNRKLTAEERQNQLRQKERLDIEPFYNASVITLNSTFLEMVDRWFIYRGAMTTAALFIGIPLTLVTCSPFILLSYHMPLTKGALMALGIPFFGSMPLWAILIWGLLKESFRWTHFPMRFNYRKRMVYVFCLDGVIRSARWDDLFFTLGRCERTPVGYRWDIRGHALKADGETVEWTFALNGDSVYIQLLKHTWEFVRRYMEDGPASVYRNVPWCHDIATKRETYRAGLDSLFLMYNGMPISQMIFAPIFWLVALGRWFVMKTSKIPQWPKGVEAQCAVDPFDPYRRDASMNPDTFPTAPISTIKNKI